MEKKEAITINGAGLVGSLLSVLLARRGFDVEVYDMRPDPTENQVWGGRSINLALSNRGWQALKKASVTEEVEKTAIPMKGRMMHSTSGELTFQPYGKSGQAIYSVSREGLNRLLVGKAKTMKNTHFYFSHKCSRVELDKQRLTFKDLLTEEKKKVHYDYLIGTDGAYSKVRLAMQRKNRFNYSQQFLEHGYKELRIPPNANGDFAMEPHALHIWPRKQFMLIALPNPDKSFTATLFLAYEGAQSFKKLQTDEQVSTFFKEEFPDTLELIPDLLEQFHRNPTPSLVTIRCSPWNYENALLMGDSSHAIVPFYGQGMNAGFEDCFLFDQLLEQSDIPLCELFDAFQANRKKDADAIADLALQNFIEMRDLVADPEFLLRKKIEARLNQLFPEKWLPLYSMVTFSHIPYSKALAIGKKQEAVMDRLMKMDEVRNNWQVMDFTGMSALDEYFGEEQ